MFIESLQQAINKLDLTDDQKQQIKDVVADAKQKIADIRQKALSGDNVQQNLQELRQSLRSKLQGILSPDQLQSLQQSIQQYRQEHGGQFGTGQQPGRAGSPKGPVAETKPEDLISDGPELGTVAPEVRIIEADGPAFTPSKFKGHVVVLEFASLSCPVFRQHVQAMEKLKAAEGQRAFFVLVYTRENFPAGEKNVESNKADGIAVPDATNLDERKSQALATQRQLHITFNMAVDSMDNAVSKAFGTFPNGTVVIGKDGTIAARDEWTNPDTLKEAIDDAANQTPAPVASAH